VQVSKVWAAAQGNREYRTNVDIGEVAGDRGGISSSWTL
jgi:hypothetical protein